jgi:hypothetical protein
VEVLIASRELGQRYGEEPVAMQFCHGEGEVFHMISHYYLQRTETRSARHSMPAAEYAEAKGVALDQEAEDLAVTDVESAASSSRLLANVVAAKKRTSEGRRS